MKPFAVLLAPALLLAAAETTAPPGGPLVPGSNQALSGPHVNRHMDAHVPAQAGAPAPGEEPRRKPPADPFRGVLNPLAPTVPSAVQPPRDRRY
jgi:hypothetical protein